MEKRQTKNSELNVIHSERFKFTFAMVDVDCLRDIAACFTILNEKKIIQDLLNV